MCCLIKISNYKTTLLLCFLRKSNPPRSSLGGPQRRVAHILHGRKQQRKMGELYGANAQHSGGKGREGMGDLGFRNDDLGMMI
jgi:hypothetical protein